MDQKCRTTFHFVLSVEMALKTKGRKGKRPKKDLQPQVQEKLENDDPLKVAQGHGVVAVRLPQDHCSISVPALHGHHATTL